VSATRPRRLIGAWASFGVWIPIIVVVTSANLGPWVAAAAVFDPPLVGLAFGSQSAWGVVAIPPWEQSAG
jgi:hypothetical protein